MDRDPHEREFVPIREPGRERSLDRTDYGDPRGRDRSLDRLDRGGGYIEDDSGYGTRDAHHRSRSARQSPNPDLSMKHGFTRDTYILEMQRQNEELQKELSKLKKELEMTNQKLGSSMHSIKTFWSPELKKERALRKEESAKYGLINDQVKLLTSENQVSCFLQHKLRNQFRVWFIK